MAALKRSRRGERGATMVSVMLLTVSLLTVSMLVVSAGKRDLKQSSALVARERALDAAQSAADLAVGQIRAQLAVEADATVYINGLLAGDNPPGANDVCDNIAEDCIPGGGVSIVTNAAPITGMRVHDATSLSDCGGRPCMRPGAIAELRYAAGGGSNPWADVPMTTLMVGGDPEARVTVWIRNNMADALGPQADDGLVAPANNPLGWVTDRDSRVVVTAMAEVRNTFVTVEQEYNLAGSTLPATWVMQSPDQEAFGGHNNDNASVDVCADNALAVAP